MTKPATVVAMSALVLVLAVAPVAWTAPDDFFQTNKPVNCGPFQEIVGLISGKDFNEQPVWIAPSGTDTTYYALFRNTKTRSWTLVQYGKDTGCVLGLGRGDAVYWESSPN